MANSRPARLQEKSQKYLRAHFGSSSPPVYKECKLNVLPCLQEALHILPSPIRDFFKSSAVDIDWRSLPCAQKKRKNFFFALFDIETFLIRQCEPRNTLSCMVRVKPFKKNTDSHLSLYISCRIRGENLLMKYNSIHLV